MGAPTEHPEPVKVGPDPADGRDMGPAAHLARAAAFTLLVVGAWSWFSLSALVFEPCPEGPATCSPLHPALLAAGRNLGAVGALAVLGTGFGLLAGAKGLLRTSAGLWAFCAVGQVVVVVAG